MKASDLTTDELRRENKRLIRNLSRRITNIEGLSQEVPLYAVDKFHETTDGITIQDINKMSREELLNLNRDLRYIDSLKSSTVAGAKQVEKTYEPVKKRIDGWSEEKKKIFWDIYKKLYGRNPLIDKFKYTVLDVASQKLSQDVDDEKIIANLQTIFDDVYIKYEGKINNTKATNELIQRFNNIIPIGD